jgi:hypothetical protein
MKNVVRPVVLFSLLVIAMSFAGAVEQVRAGSAAGDRIGELLSMGKPGDKTFTMKVWPNKGAEDFYHKGDRLFFDMQTNKDAYVTIVAVSSNGAVTVLSPNGERLNNLVKAKEVYTLFGDDSPIRLRMGKEVKSTHLIFYLSPKPFTLDSMKIPPDGGVIQFNVTEDKKFEEFKRALENASNNAGLFRVVIPLKGKKGAGFNLIASRVSLADEEAGKALPIDVKSRKPESMTGVQGRSIKLFTESGAGE